MTYGDWNIGGVTLPWIVKADWTNLEQGQIILSCAALEEDTNADPRLALDALKAISSTSITNTILMNGGSIVQVTGGTKITITENSVSWTGALHYPRFVEESEAEELIEFELVLEIELPPIKGSFVYTPNYADYSNIEYYMWTDKTNPSHTHEAYGNEIGWMKITEVLNVKRVEVYGSGDITQSGIQVNGSAYQYWTFGHGDQAGDDTLPRGTQKLTFDITPTTEITVNTTIHTETNSETTNHGCWLLWVRVFYE